MFAEVLGLAGAAASAYGSMQSAKSAAAASMYQTKMAEYARQQQEQFNRYVIGRSEDYYRDQVDRYNQGVDFYKADRGTKANESAISRSLLNEDRGQKKDEYQSIVERQMGLDKDAARNREFQLQQYIRSQGISASERATALDELKNAQAIASGERDEDMRRFYEDRATRSNERQFQIDELRRAQEIAASNRAMTYNQRGAYDTATGDLRNATQAALRQLGNIREAPSVTNEDINAEVERRRGNYSAALDHAANIASSQNEAALIRGGVDASSTGATRRAEVARALGDKYVQADNQATDDALKYMSGLQNTLFQGYDKDIARRAQVMNETRLPIASYLEALRAAPQISGDLGIGPSFAAVGSGIFDKNVRSANDYRSPLQVGSAYNPSNLQLIGGNFGQNLAATATALGPRDFTTGIMSSGMGSYVPSLQNPMSGLTGLNFGADSAARSADSARTYATNASNSFGLAGGKALDMFGKALDNWWDRPSGGSNYQWANDANNGNGWV